MKTGKTTKPFGGAFNRAMGALLKEHGFDAIDPATRSEAAWLVANLQEVIEWRDSLPEYRRIALNRSLAPHSRYEPRLCPSLHVGITRPMNFCSLRAGSQPLSQLRPPPAPRNTSDGDRDGLALADQNDQSFASSDTCVERIALQHGVMLRHDRNDGGRVF
jgi:hypothetical protein